MTWQEQLEDFQARRDNWERFGIDGEVHRELCEMCCVAFEDDPEACTVANALMAAVSEAVDSYFAGKRLGHIAVDRDGNVKTDNQGEVIFEHGLENKPALHRKRLEKTRMTAEALKERIDEMPEGTLKLLCGFGPEGSRYPADSDGLAGETLKKREEKRWAAKEVLDDDEATKEERIEAQKDFLLVPRSIPDEIDELQVWLERLIKASDSALERLSQSDPRSTRRSEKELARTAQEIFHTYLAFGLAEMPFSQRHEIAHGASYEELKRQGFSDGDLETRTLWSVRPENYARRRDDFIRSVLDLAGVEAPSSSSGLANWRSEFWWAPESALKISNKGQRLRYWDREDFRSNLTVRGADYLRERMLIAMDAVAQAGTIPEETFSPAGGAEFSALARVLSLDHPPLQTPHPFPEGGAGTP